MKILFILIILVLNMINTDFETLLGKNVSDISFIGNSENTLNDNIYIISSPKVQFLGKPINQIGISTNKDKTIQRIIIFFPQTTTVDRSFYKTISDKYGYDYDVMVVDKTLSEESSSIKENKTSFKANLRQTTMLLKKGSIEDDNIINLLWDKDNFQIILFLNNNRKQVSFVKK